MNGYALGYIYGWGLALFSLSFLPPLGLALAENETTALAGLLIAGITAGFLGGGLIIALKGHSLELNRRDKILLIILIWVSFSLIAAIPFEASGVITSRTNAIFEATSALTTTGATIVTEISLLPKSLLLWRSELQWLGGFLTLVTITFALIRIWGAERAEQEIFKSPTETTDTIAHLKTTIKLILPIYSGVSLLVLLSLVISGVPIFDSICITLSTISTGGMLPREGNILSYGSISPLYILSFAMFFGSISILWSNFFLKQKWQSLLKFKEPFWIAGSILLTTFILIWLKWTYNEGRELQNLTREIGSALFDATSLISTTGMTSSAHSYFLLSPSLMLVIILIGGGLLSTAGGIKYNRIILMLRQSRGELRSLIYPNEIRPLFLSNEEKDFRYLSTIWVIFGLTILMLVMFAAILSFFGLGLAASLFTAASALVNCGPCLTQINEVHNIASVPFISLAAPAKIAYIIAMIIGRLEFLVALSLIHFSFWRR